MMSVHEEIEEIAASETPDAPPCERDAGRARVLLVEDDKALRRYLEFKLVQSGYEVIPAADGLEGMKVALSSSVDIIVTDAMMPHLSGHEFCRFLKNTPALSHIPVIMLSGSDPQEAGVNKELADIFLAKPMSADQLTSCLEGLLKRTPV